MKRMNNGKPLVKIVIDRIALDSDFMDFFKSVGLNYLHGKFTFVENKEGCDTISELNPNSDEYIIQTYQVSQLPKIVGFLNSFSAWINKNPDFPDTYEKTKQFYQDRKNKKMMK